MENYLKVSVGNDIYNHTKYDKIQVTHTTVIKHPNIGGYLLQHWTIKCSDKNGAGEIQNFILSTRTSSLTASSEATSLAPFGDSFIYIETSANNHGPNVYCSFERTDNIQISKLIFYYNGF